MAVVEVSVVPLGTGSTGLSEYVAACQAVLQEAAERDGIKFQLTPMSTVLEGDLDQVLQVIRKMHELPFDKNALRVVTSIKIDDRRDKSATMQQKIDSVESKRL